VIDYEQRFHELSAIIYRVDPIGLNFEENPDEYDPEARTILPRLTRCGSIEDVDRVVREELGKWFSPELVSRSPTCDQVVADIWTWWERIRAG
jgi:hypothetical protein